MRASGSFVPCRRSPVPRGHGARRGFALAIAALLVGVSCGSGEAEERSNDDNRAEMADLKSRLERVEKLLDVSLTPAGHEPPSVLPRVPPATARNGDPSQPARLRLLPEQPVPPSQPSRNWNLSSLPNLFERSEYPTVNWSGFLQLDTGWIAQSEEVEQAIGDIDSQTGLRRVRLRVDGDVREHTHYVIDLDFAASGHPSFRDVALTFGDIPTIQNLEMGYFKIPFGMDAMTSGRELLFLERQLPFALVPFRQTGIRVFGADKEERTTYSVVLFGFPTDSFGVTTADSGGASIAGRLTHLIACNGDSSQLLHVGFGYAIGDPADNTVRYKIQPGFFVTDPADPDDDPTVPTIVDTGNIPANAFHLVNLEAAMALGPFHLQSEWRVSFVDQIGGPFLVFPAAYVQFGLLLTGEHANYDRQQAIFRRVIPDRDFELGHGGGAIELTFGYSFIDLTDENIPGGLAQSFTIGLNWYLHKHTKFVINLSPATLKDPTTGFGTAFVAGARAQIEF